MKSLFQLLIALCISYQISAQLKWSKLNVPQSNVVGLIVQGGTLTGIPSDNSFIRSEDGADSYIQESKRFFDINFSGSSTENLRYSNIRINKMKVDYLSDSAIFGNDNYLNNSFVYKALRADSMFLTYKKMPNTTIRPGDLVNEGIITKIKSIIPKFDSLSIVNQKGDSIVIGVANPKVYFQAAVIKMVDGRCGSCRTSFGASYGQAYNKKFIMDLRNAGRRRAQLTLHEYGTHPVFTLTIDQDSQDPKKLKLFLEVDQNFRNANGNITPEKIEIPVKEYTIDGKVVRTFIATKEYLGRIISDRNRLIGADRNKVIPVFLFIDAEQTSDTEITFNNISDGKALLSKLEWPWYVFEIYSGSVN